MKILVFDAAQDPAFDEATCKLFDEHAILVLNKADVLTGQKIAQEFPGRVPPLVISAQTGEGIPALLERLIRDIDLRFSETGSAPLTRARHRESLEDCLSHLKRSLDVAAFELRAEDTRLAMRALGRITGRVDVEDLLDVIFRDFCIGK
jgi:tRNA modification GTPase